MSIPSYNGRNGMNNLIILIIDIFYFIETIFSSIFSSSSLIMFNWISIIIYFIIVLFTIILLSGIQYVNFHIWNRYIINLISFFLLKNKSWLVFFWSILMIIMLLVDGIVTIFSLQQRQLQVYFY